MWVGLWRSNVVVQDPRSDGSIDAKFGWWRGAVGTLRIEGRRLDGPAPPLRANIPTGYGDSGFQAAGIIFPTTGCWEVTGRVGDASLTFVTLVIASVRPSRHGDRCEGRDPHRPARLTRIHFGSTRIEAASSQLAI